MPTPPFRPGRPTVGGPTRSELAIDTQPHVYRVDPNADRVAGGASITVYGKNFTSDVVVTFGDEVATNVVIVSDTELTCDAPAQAGPDLVDVTVTNGAGQFGTLENCFSYVQPLIEAITPNYGPLTGGTPVVITGGNFLLGAVVLFDGVAATDIEVLDAQHISCVTPAHAVGPITVTVDGYESPFPFYYTLLTRGEDIRRNPSIRISEHLGNVPNTCHFTVDGTSSPPTEGSVVEIVDSQDGDRLLFAGVVQYVEQVYEDQITQLAWNVQAIDFTFWLNRRRPFGTYLNVSVSSIVLDLCAKFAPWVDTSYVQTSLCNANISFDGSEDFAGCLSKLARLLGAGYWYIDYERRLHFFHTVVPSTGNQAQPTTQNASGVVENGTLPGVGNVMTVAVSGSYENSGLQGRFHVFRTSFVYESDDPFSNLRIETALSPITDMIYRPVDGRLIQLSNIPLAPALSGYTCIARNIYVQLFGGADGTLGVPTIIRDNTTTSILFTGDAARNPGVSMARGSKAPSVPVVAPPAGPTVAVGASIGSRSAASLWAELTGRSAGEYGGTTATYVTFKHTAVYRDGTESQGSPASNSVLNNAGKVIVLDVPPANDINGVEVVYRKIYAAIPNVLSTDPSALFERSLTIGWWVVPGNEHVVVETMAGFGFRDGKDNLNPPNSGGGGGQTNTLDPCDGDGPYLEDALPLPADIDEDNDDLLRDSPLTSSIDMSQVRNRVFVRGSGTLTVADAAVGASVLEVADAGAVPNSGEVLVGTQGRVLRVQGQAPTLGTAALYLSEPLSEILPSGTPIRSIAVISDPSSQAALGRVEVDIDGEPSDGIHEFFIEDPSLKTYQQQISRGFAELEMFSRPIVTVRYSTRDPNSHPGRKVNIDLPNPPLKGQFLIQSVSLDQIHDESDTLMPRYNVEASSVKYSLEDLLLLIAAGVKQSYSPGSGDMIGVSPTGIVETAVAQAVAQIPTPEPTTSGVIVVERNFSRAELATLDTVPIAIVAAPSATQMHRPLFWSVELDKTVASGGPAPQFRLRHDNQTVDLCTALNSDLNNARSFFQSNVSATQQYNPAVGLPIQGAGAALEVDFVSGPGVTFQATARITVWYSTITMIN